MVGDNTVSTENGISTGVLVPTRSLEFGAITLWYYIICRAGIKHFGCRTSFGKQERSQQIDSARDGKSLEAKKYDFANLAWLAYSDELSLIKTIPM